MLTEAERFTGTPVKLRGFGKGIIIGPSVPPTKTYVRVRWDRGDEANAPVDDLERVVPKIPPKVRAEAALDDIRSSGVSYWFVGRLLSGLFRSLGVEVPPWRLDHVMDDLTRLAVPNVDKATLSASDNQSEAYYVLFEKFDGYQKLQETGVNVWDSSRRDRKNARVNSHYFVRDFLLGELSFQLGHVQDLDAIRRRIPTDRVPSFEEGLHGR